MHRSEDSLARKHWISEASIYNWERQTRCFALALGRKIGVLRIGDPGSDVQQPITIHKRVSILILDEWMNLKGARILDADCAGGGYIRHVCSSEQFLRD
jgi:hypothetical protein